MMRWVGLVTLMAFSTFCAVPASAQSFPHAKLARQMLEKHIRPTYRSLESSFAELSRITRAACADGSASSSELNRIDAAYRSSVFAWAKASHLRFGPVTEQNRFEAIVFWPDRKGRGRKQVARLLRGKGDEARPMLDASMLNRKSVAVRGLTAFEVILYGTSVNSKRVGAIGPFACSAAQAVADNLANIAQAVLKAWQNNGSWSQLWLAPGEENPAYLSQKEVTREFSHAFLNGMKELRDRHLVAPLGFARGRIGRVYRPLFAASGLSTTYLRGGVLGLSDMFNAGGLKTVLREFDELQTNGVDGQLRETLKAANGLDATPTGDLTQGSVREYAISMGFPMKSIVFHTSALLQQHASLSLGFNASDGD